MSRREGSAETDFDEVAEGAETANPLAPTGAEDKGGQASFAPSARALRRMPEGPGWPNNFPWFTHDGRTFASGLHSAENELRLTDVCTGESSVGVRRSGEITATSLAPDGATFCVAGRDGLAVYHLAAGSGVELPLKPEWHVTTLNVIDAAFSRDGKHIASVRAESGLLEVRDVGSSDVIFELEDFAAEYDKWSPGGVGYSEELLAVAGRRGDESERRVRLLPVASKYKDERILDLELEGHTGPS